MRSRRRSRHQRGGVFGWFESDSNNNNDDIPRCQCPKNADEEPCRTPVVKGTVFCEKHQNCKAPSLSNELPYKPELYDPKEIQLSHNCLAYALRILNPLAIESCRKSKKNCRDKFKQPGDVSGDRDGLSKDSRLKCPVVERMLLKDYPTIRKSTFYTPCPRGYRKIAGVVDKGNDHHWYARHGGEADGKAKRGYWSHKSGELPVTLLDAQGQPIFNPRQASRNYTKKRNSNLNYEDFCGFYCVPSPPQGQVVSMELLRRERQRRRQQERKQERKTRRR